jgi:hypothetical protein
MGGRADNDVVSASTERSCCGRGGRARRCATVGVVNGRGSKGTAVFASFLLSHVTIQETEEKNNVLRGRRRHEA